MSVSWTTSGGAITSAGLFTAPAAGKYTVTAWGDRRRKLRGTTTVTVVAAQVGLVHLTLSPDSVKLLPGATQRFAAQGVLTDSSRVETAVTWTGGGGAIDAAGTFVAGTAPGRYRVVATSVGSPTADTATVVVVSPPAPLLISLDLTPSTATLQPGSSQRFGAVAHMSDGSTSPATVTYRATGGSITTDGSYTAPGTSGVYRVVATATTSTATDTSVITVATAPAPAPPDTASPPPPTTGRTFFLADAETGNLNAWSLPWGVVQQNGTVTASQTKTHSGGWAYKYEVTSSGNPMVGAVAHDVRTMTGNPQVSMGSPNGRYLSGYYSFWTYVDAGFTSAAEGGAWNLFLGWMTGVTGAPSPISNLGLEVWGGTLQLTYQLKNCAVGLYVCPVIPGYTLNGGVYRMNAGSPAGIVPFPRQQWVHVVAYYKMAPTNGQLTVWQDGVKIMDLTAPTMNTFGGHSSNLTNTAGDMLLQFGDYGGMQSGTQRMYVDEFKVTDYLPQQ